MIQFPFTMFYFKPLLVLVVVNLTFGSTNCSSLLTYMQLWVICTALAIFSVSQVFKGDVSQNEEPNGRSDAWQHDQPEGKFVFEILADKLMETDYQRTTQMFGFSVYPALTIHSFTLMIRWAWLTAVNCMLQHFIHSSR